MVRYRSREEVVSSINITPFTDIVLVLLIVFMIAAPGLMNPGIDIELPGSTSAHTQKPADHTVGLDRQGKIYMDGKLISLEELRTTAAHDAAAKSSMRIVVNADASAKHGDVIRVIDTLKASGVADVYVGTVKD